MQLTLTYKQIESAVQALNAFNPPNVSLRIKCGLSRDLAKLKAIWEDKEQIRQRLLRGHLKDKEEKLSVEAEKLFEPEYRELMSHTRDVDLFVFTIYDSTSSPTPADPERSIDIKSVAIPNSILGDLLDIVLFESLPTQF